MKNFNPRGIRAVATYLVIATLALTGCIPIPQLAPEAAPAPAAPAAPPAAGTVLATLDTILIKGRAPDTYDRKQFGQAWKDVDKNGCDQRNDLLRKSLRDIVIKPGTRGCVVLSGTMADPYTGTDVAFERGGASELDLDHLVPLKDAHLKGAQSWDQEKREAFANDLDNLVPVSAKTNRSKGAGDLATWLPPNRAYWCEYAERIVTIKASYGLWMTQAEHDRARQILSGCTPAPAAEG